MQMSDSLCKCLNKINGLIKSQMETALGVSEDYFFQSFSYAWGKNTAIRKNKLVTAGKKCNFQSHSLTLGVLDAAAIGCQDKGMEAFRLAL